MDAVCDGRFSYGQHGSCPDCLGRVRGEGVQQQRLLLLRPLHPDQHRRHQRDVLHRDEREVLPKRSDDLLHDLRSNPRNIPPRRLHGVPPVPQKLPASRGGRGAPAHHRRAEGEAIEGRYREARLKKRVSK